MADESGVTPVEAGMLAESLREISPAPAQAAEPSAPVPPEPQKKAAVVPPGAAPAKKAAPAPPPSQQPAAETKPYVPDPDKWKNVIQYILYALIALLAIVQIAALAKLSATSNKLSELEKTVSTMKADFGKSQEEQDKKFAESLREKEQNEAESRKMSIAAETLNRLRNGLPEQRLIRKKGGDWYIMGKKEEAVGNSEVIEILNAAYVRAKAQERSALEMPPHTDNAVIVLRPDGKGGTQVTTTYDFIVGGKKEGGP